MGGVEFRQSDEYREQYARLNETGRAEIDLLHRLISIAPTAGAILLIDAAGLPVLGAIGHTLYVAYQLPDSPVAPVIVVDLLFIGFKADLRWFLSARGRAAGYSVRQIMPPLYVYAALTRPSSRSSSDAIVVPPLPAQSP